jgi:hypothetical protein
MAKLDIPAISSKLYELLEPLEPSIRKRAIKATLTMLGDNDVDLEPDKPKEEEASGSGEGTGVPLKVRTWMRTNSITEDQLQHTFHIENGQVELIVAELPGKTGKERTVNAYILAGLTQFLETGEPKFDDKSARAVCKSHGCLDESNHAYNLKGKGNMISGTKESGWTLTGPGLKSGADIVKSTAASR